MRITTLISTKITETIITLMEDTKGEETISSTSQGGIIGSDPSVSFLENHKKHFIDIFIG